MTGHDDIQATCFVSVERMGKISGDGNSGAPPLLVLPMNSHQLANQ
jgi:hypothetical protein